MANLGSLVGYRPKAPKPAKLDKTGHEHFHKSRVRREEWKGDRTQLNRIEANERDKRMWRRYTEGREFAYGRLKECTPQVAKFEAWLGKVKHSGVEAYSRRDCDVDLSHGIRRLGLAGTLGFREAWLVFEHVSGWLGNIAKEQRVYTFDDPGPFFADTEPTALDEAKDALGIT